MHLHGLGDIRQHHGFHKLFALLEERLLLADDAAGDLQQRLVAALQAFNQPLGFLQVAADELAVGFAAGVVASAAYC